MWEISNFDCETTVKETEDKVKEIDSKLQLNLPLTEYSDVKEQVKKKQVTIQQLQRKKMHKYRQLKYGEQIPEKQTQNLKVNQLNQEHKEENNENNQYNSKRTYTATWRSIQPTEQKNKTVKTNNAM